MNALVFFGKLLVNVLGVKAKLSLDFSQLPCITSSALSRVVWRHLRACEPGAGSRAPAKWGVHQRPLTLRTARHPAL